MAEPFEGAMTALITPDNMKDFEKLLRYQIEYGIHGLLPCGTTGQSPTLDWEEHRDLIETTIRIADGNATVLAGTGSNNTKEAVKATQEAIGMGADGTLHVTGYYNCPSQQGFVDYFSQVAEARDDGKVIIYNIPGRGHPLIRPEIMIGLAKEYPNIIGTKDATGGKQATYYPEEASFWKAVREEARKEGLDKHTFKLISGDDPNTYKMMTDPDIEGVGVISVWANIFPHAYADMCNHLLAGKYEEGKKINDTLTELNSLVSLKFTDGHYVKIGNNKVWIPDDTFRNPEAVQMTAYELGMISSPDMRSPMGFLSRGQWGEKLGHVLLDLYNNELGEYLFNPIQEFFKPNPNIGQRLAFYGGD